MRLVYTIDVGMVFLLRKKSHHLKLPLPAASIYCILTYVNTTFKVCCMLQRYILPNGGVESVYNKDNSIIQPETFSSVRVFLP